MKVLVIGSDPNLYNENSDVFSRVKEYAALFDEYYIVNMTGRGCTQRSFGNFHLLSANSLFPFLRIWDAFWLARGIVNRYKIDIVDAQDPAEAGLVAWVVARSVRIGFRLQIHTDIFSPWFRRAGWKEYIRFWLAKFLVPRADCIRVVSERIKRSILLRSNLPWEVRPPKIPVLPIYTDISKFLDAKPDPVAQDRFKNYDFKIVAVGRFVDKEKNFSMLINMMQDFVRVCPRALLVLVGDGPDYENYESRIKNQGLENCVTLEKWRNNLPSFYQSFDLYLMSSNYEGWGRTVIEALASGLPVVMTDVGLAGEVVKNKENGVIVPVADKEAMLQVVTDLYKNPKLRAKFAKAGLEIVKNLEPKSKEEYLKSYAASYCYSKN